LLFKIFVVLTFKLTLRASILKIRTLQFRKVHFYTVHVENRLQAEFDNFSTRMSARCPRKFGELLSFIAEMGQEYGALDQFFRHERNSHALPPHHVHLSDDDLEESSKFGLRLYCCKFTPEVALLYNGDLKTTQYPDVCPNVAKHFGFALRATTAIDKAIRDGYIQFDGYDILIDEDFALEI